MTLLVGLLQSNPLLREELINISLAGHSLDLKPWSLLIPPTVWSVRSVLLLTRRCLMPPHGSHFNSNCLSTGTLQKKILKQYFEFKMDEFQLMYYFYQFSAICGQIKMSHSIYMLSIQFNTKSLVFVIFSLVKQNQIVLLCKPYVARFLEMGNWYFFLGKFSKN